MANTGCLGAPASWPASPGARAGNSPARMPALPGKLVLGVSFLVSRIRQRPQKRHERALIVVIETYAAIRMFREIWIQRRAAFQAGAVMPHDLFERGEPPVMHVGRGQDHVAQRGRREF